MNQRSALVIGIVLALAVVVSVVAFLVGATADGDEDEDETHAPREVDVVDVLTAPDEYFDQDVVVEGEVAETLGPAIFTIEGDDSTELLITASQDMIPEDLSEDSQVTAEGTIQRFSQDQPLIVEEGDELDPDLYERAFEEYEGNPVLVASDLNVAAGDADDTDDQAADEIGATTFPEIVANPEAYVGQEVTVHASIQERVAPGAWAIGSDQAEVDALVLTTGDRVPVGLTEDALVRVTGTFVSFDPEQEYEIEGEALDIGGEQDDALSDWQEEPAIVADAFELIAPAAGQMAENILDSPDEYAGEQVLLPGTVASVDADNAFVLDSGEQTLRVVAPADVMPEGIVEEAIVHVTGVVHPFNPGDPQAFEDAGIDTNQDFFEELDGDPVVIASSIQVLAQERGPSIDDIVLDREAYVDQQVTVAGMVEDELTIQSFTLAGVEFLFGLSDENLLVIGPNDVVESAVATEDLIVVVTGTVRLFDGDIVDEYIGEAFENPDLLRDFNEEAVIVADSIEVFAVE